MLPHYELFDYFLLVRSHALLHDCQGISLTQSSSNLSSSAAQSTHIEYIPSALFTLRLFATVALPRSLVISSILFHLVVHSRVAESSPLFIHSAFTRLKTLLPLVAFSPRWSILSTNANHSLGAASVSLTHALCNLRYCL